MVLRKRSGDSPMLKPAFPGDPLSIRGGNLALRGRDYSLQQMEDVKQLSKTHGLVLESTHFL